MVDIDQVKMWFKSTLLSKRK